MTERTGEAAGDDVAVVGIGCRFPGAEDHHAFFRNVMAGVCSVTEVTPDRWDVERFYSPDPSAVGKSISKWCGQISGIDRFDHEFFGMTPKEARMSDPQQRLLLEQAWRSLEDAGIAPDVVRAARTSVYVGVMARDHLQRVSASSEPTEALSALGGYDFMLANRLSHVLGLTGPSVAVDAACASSLVAVHHGIRALVDGEVDIALAGGVSLNLHPWRYVAFSKARMLSRDGRCKTFDRSADGYVPGEGVAVVVLRRLSDALADGDHVYGVLSGSAVNHGGARRTVTAPTLESQCAVVGEALRVARLTPEQIGYVEAHGTGTSLGDPIEVHALRRVFGAKVGDGCWLGSVKPNIGHLEAAAGMAGLIKVLMMMTHRRVPPSIHLEEPNPLLDLESGPFRVTTEPREWRSSEPLAAGVSSFGMGGVNAHVVVREAPAPADETHEVGGSHPFLLSAPTARSLDRLRERWANDPSAWCDLPLRDVSRTLTSGRAHHAVRVGTVVASSDDIDRALALPVSAVAAEAWWLRVVPWSSPNVGALRAAARRRRERSPDVPERLLDELLTTSWGPRHDCLLTVLVLDEFLVSGFRPTAIAARGAAIWPAAALAGALSVEEAVERALDPAASVRWRAPRTALVDPHGREVPVHRVDETYLGGLVNAGIPPHEVDAAIAEAAAMVDTQHSLRAALTKWNRAVVEHGVPMHVVPLSRTELVRPDGTPQPIAHWRAVACQAALDEVRTRWSLPIRRHLRGRDVGEVLDLLLDGVLEPGELIEFVGADPHRRAEIARPLIGRVHLVVTGRPYAGLRALDRSAELDAWADACASGTLPSPPTGTRAFDAGSASAMRPGDVALHDCAEETLTRTRVALWAAGVDVDWSMFADPRAKRVPVPVHPFEPTPHELVAFGPAQETPGSGPALHRLTKSWRETVGNRAPDAGRVLVVAKAAARTRRLGLDSVVVDAAEVRGLASSDLPDHIVVVGDGPDSREAVVDVIRMLAKDLSGRAARVVYVCRGGAHEVALTGLARSLRRETPQVRLTVMQTDAQEPEEFWRGVSDELRVVEPADHVRRVGQRREVETVGASALAAPTPASAFRAGGVYLVTGGSGGLARILADHIVRDVGGTAVLVSRSPLAGEEGGDGRLVRYRADVTDVEAMRAVITDVDARHGAVTGVVHAAGVLRDGLIREKSGEDFRAVCAPKITGTMVVDEVTRHEPLEFFGMLSSAVAWVGNLGQSDYATANAFLDAYVLEREMRRRAGECRGSTVALALPLWAEGGMTVREHNLGIFAAGRGLEPMPTSLGLTLVNAALAGPPSAVGYLYGNTADVNELLAEPNPREGVADAPRDDGILSLAQRYLRETVASLTEARPDDIDLDAGLDEVGIDSIQISQLNAALERDLGGMPQTLLFECRTLGEAALRVAQERGDRLVQRAPEAPVSTGPAPERPRAALITTTKADARAPQPRPVSAGDGADRDGGADGTPKVAIIGMSGRYPSAPDIASFWDLLREGRHAVRDIPPERWAVSDTAYCSWGAFLDDAEYFDPLFFSISPREAELIDPQERLFLQAAWHALEDAGYPPHRLGPPGHRPVGVFVGITTLTHQLRGPGLWRQGETAIPTSTPWSVANRVSYFLDLNGPSMPVDTACAASLSAVHLACASLAARECRLALVGGVNLYLHPSKYEWLCQMRMLSATGRCHTFGEAADGFVPGEGVGALLLKPLDDALADGDRIHGVIVGTAVNHGGRTSGFTVPNPNAQAAVVRRALAAAGLEPREVDYVEAHGTGTPLGDPIEIAGLTRAFDGASEPVERESVPVGSVKTNIGHLESAAGIAGLTKVLLQMRYGLLAPSLGAERTNPRIDFAATPFRVQRELEEWAPPADGVGRGRARRAGVSSFGAGGANAHVVLEEHLADAEDAEELAGPHLVVVSAREQDRLAEHCANLAAAVAAAPARADAVAYHLQVRREPMAERVAFLAADRDEVIAGLSAVAEGRRPERSWAGRAARRVERAEDLTRALAAHDLAALAELWTAGVAVPWSTLYRAPLPNVDLPGYPFAKERCSVEPTGPRPAQPSRPITPGPDVDFVVVLDAADPMVGDHRVDGEPVYPAVGCLEIVRCAVAAKGHVDVRFRNNVWTSPLRVPDTTPVFVELIPSEDGYDYVVYSTGEGGEKQVHVQGRADTRPTADAPAACDIEAIRRRCGGEPISPDDFYCRVGDLGLQLGPSYRGLTGLSMGVDEAVGEVEAPRGGPGPSPEVVLAPGLFDSALQGALALVGRVDPGALHLPFSIGSVEFAGRLPLRFSSHVVLRTTTESAKKIDVSVVDDAGGVVLAVRDLWLRRWAARPTTDGSTSAVPGSAFRPTWSPERGGWRPPEGCVLVVAPSAASVAAWPGSAVVATIGATLEHSTPRTLDPSDPAAWRRFVDECPGVRDIVFAVPEVSGQPSDGLEPGPEVEALVHLLRAAVSATRGPLRLLVVHADANGTGHPVGRALGGLLRVAEREYERLSYRLVGLARSSWRRFLDGDHDVVSLVCSELGDDWPDARTVRYTPTGREVLRWQRAELAGAWRPAAGSTYVITGGAGRLGLALAGDVASHGADVILCGRSRTDARIEAAVRRLRSLGSRVEYVRADVSREDDVLALMRTVRERFGAITGVVHAAGVLQDGYLATLDLADLRAVASPKMRGAVLLDAATRHDRLEEFVLFSSVAAPLGTPGQASYAYANAFLDAFAAWRHEKVARGERSGRTFALDLPLWRSGGMTVDAEVERSLEATFGIRPLETEAGLSALSAMLAGPEGQILYVPGDGVKVARQLGARTAADSGPAVPASPPASAPTRRPERTEGVAKVIAAEVAAIAKLDVARVRASAEIGDYGLDSVAFTRLANRLNELLGVEVTPALFFEHTTVASVASHLAEVFADSVDAALGADAAPPPPSEQVAAVAPVSGEEPSAPVFVASGRPVERSASRDVVGTEPIAIVGMHGVMPGSDDLDVFWDNLVGGRDLVTEIPAGRWDWRRYYSESRGEPGKTNSRWGGFVRAVDEFDHEFFGISPREASLMDPQQRIFLQTAHAAIEEAGYRPTDLANGRTGLFVGVATHDYHELQREAGLPVEAYTTTGMFHAILANRVSYLLNLKGPSFPIDTACSSSLVALRSGVEAIRSGSCDAAIVGGVNLLLSPMIYISFAHAGMLSPTGRCRTFDAAADGYVRGEGAGALLLKPLSAALSDGDHVHAVIEGSAVNHGGRVNTLTTPNPNGQSDLICQAFREAGVDPAEVTYMEMHGTGTALGDPIEVNGLKKAFRTLRDENGARNLAARNTFLGSVKTNIGHLEAAAGMASIFKVVLSMKHGRIPGNLHLENLNPHISLDDTPFAIAENTMDWPSPTGTNGQRQPRRAGVSSFGFGGVNAHVLLAEHVEPPVEPGDGGDERVPRAFVLSARSPERLRAYAGDLADWLGTSTAASAGVGAEELRAMAAEILGVSASQINEGEPLTDLGFEGARVADLRVAAHERLHLPMDEVLPSRSLRQIAAHLPADARPVSLRDLAFTLQVGRTEMATRFAVVADSAVGLRRALSAFAAEDVPTPGVFSGECDPAAGEGMPIDPTTMDPALVAQRWVGGAVVEWQRAYRGTSPRRLSLPTYPFAASRHWLPEAETHAKSATADHTCRYTHSSPLVADHLVDGVGVVPGVEQLALAVAALEERGVPARELRDVAWLAPIEVDEAGYEVRVRLTVAQDDVGFEVVGVQGGREIVHSRGRSLRDPGRSSTGHEPVPHLFEGCDHEMRRDDIYRAFTSIGLAYGPSLRVLDGVTAGADVAVAEFTVPPGCLHRRQAVLDAALQAVTAAEFARADGRAVTKLPFSVARFEQRRPLPASGRVVVRHGREVEVRVLDDSGQVCAVFDDVVVRPRKDPLTGLAFTSHWALEPTVTARTLPQSCLIVAPEQCFGLDEAIAARYPAGSVRRIRLGDCAGLVGDRFWEVSAADPSFDACLDDATGVRDLWFLGGISAQREAVGGVPPLDPATTLFRLVKALGRSGATGEPPALRVVVNDVHDVDGRRTANPAGGSLVGLAGALAQENPGQFVSCTDVGLPVGARPNAVQVQTIVSALLDEPASTEVAYVDGVRYTRRLRPAALPEGRPTSLRDQGVYVVVGGAGGVGRVLAEHLARSVSARIALIGRSPAGPEVAELVDRLGALGGKAVYLSADVADPQAMSRALAQVRRTLGPVDGVVHAAMCLRDGVVDRMTESDFTEVLRPKVAGSRVLVDLLADEPLDFLVFLSSIQSFATSAGQANYAAASTGQDAIARHAARTVDYPVRIVNWGYWGTVGRVATEEHRRVLGARGFHSLFPEEGVAALERLLSSDEEQVAVVRADPPALRVLGVESGAAPAPQITSRLADLGAQSTVVRRMTDEAILVAALDALQCLGLWAVDGQAHSRDDLVTQARILPRYARLVDGLVGMLLKAGHLVDTVDGLARAPLDGQPPAVTTAELRARYPELRARLALVERCLSAMADVLTGKISAVEVLFPGGADELVAPIYRGDPLTDYCNELVADEVIAAVRGVSGVAEVLEVGAGTGGTTRAVARALSGLQQSTRYTVTDVSSRLVRDTERALRGEGFDVHGREFDVTRSAFEQGLSTGSCHVVVAANVLHATPDLGDTLRGIRDLLVPGGSLVLTEVTTVEAFHMVTFGLLNAWWGYTDPMSRLEHSPLLDAGMWRDRLRVSGFTDVRIEGAAVDGARPSQRVIVASAARTSEPNAPAPVRTSASAAPPIVAPHKPQAQFPEPPACGVPRALIDLLCELTAGCLGMAVSDIDPDATLSAFGVDSIVGVELITKINAALGVVVRTIALFDHPTITALAEHLVEGYGPAVRSFADRGAGSAPEDAIDHGTAPGGSSTPVPSDVPFAARSARAATAVPQRIDDVATRTESATSSHRAVRFLRPADPIDLVVTDHAPVAPGPGEVEVLVRAFPINFSDFLLAKGLYPMMPEFPFTPGVEVSGVVGRVGEGVTRVAPGDEVIALTRPEMGGQATAVVTDETFVVRKPASVTHEEACGFPVAFLSMFLAFERARPRPGERMLIPAATGTNGLIALQLARLAGVDVIATAGGPRKVAHLEALGVTEVIDHAETDFAQEVLRRTGGRGVDIVVNTLGDGAMQKGLNTLAPEGRYVEIAVFGLQASGPVDLSRLVDNQSVHSFNTKKFFLRHPDLRTAYLDTMAEYLGSGRVRPTVARVFSLDEVKEAYAAKNDRSVIGRIVVTVPAVVPAGRPEPAAAWSTDSSIESAAPKSTDIAIIGRSGRFAGAPDVDRLWANLAAGVDSVREVPGERWSSHRFYDANPGRLDASYCRWGGFLDDIDRFDAAFFGISGKEAAYTDPQQRVFLEEAWKAVQDAGTPTQALHGARWGVFVGVGPSSYLTRMNAAGATRHAQTFWGNEASVLAARVSYVLNLRGPSVAVNTACSSSLVALHLACQSLLSGESEVAVAGGVFLMLAPDYFVVASNSNMLSPRGRCHTFDDSADGFGPGEGCGVLVLKPLDRALADGDRIHGVIKGTALNQDGKTNGITAPSAQAQAEVELAAYERAGISADSIGYVEAHGTGTKLGDPIEIDALTRAFRAHTQRTGFSAIGSVKTNIGHTAAAAGMAGLLKVLALFEHDQIPPSLHYATPNRHIDFADSPFFVNTELRPWPRVPGTPRRAAVSSFGFSGTNAHVVLEEPPVTVLPQGPAGPLAVPLSARSETALRANAEALGEWLLGPGKGVPLAQVAHTCQVRRDHFADHRAVYVVADTADLATRLCSGDPGREVTTVGPQGALASRYLDGERVDWAQAWPGAPLPPLSMPGYAFDRTRHWFVEDDTVYAGAPVSLTATAETGDAATVRVSFTGADRYLRDHVVNGDVVVPAALHLEAVAQAAGALRIPCEEFTDVVWARPLVVGAGTAAVDVRFDGTRFSVLAATPDPNPDSDTVVYVRGVVAARGARKPAPVGVPEDDENPLRPVDSRTPYRRMADSGLRHGPSLLVLDDVTVGSGRAAAEVRLPPSSPGEQDAVLHPAVLDGAMQLLAVVEPTLPAAALPFAVERVTVYAPLRGSARAVLSARPGNADAYDICVHDEHGAVAVELVNLSVKSPGGDAPRREMRARALLEQVRSGALSVDRADAALEAIFGE